MEDLRSKQILFDKIFNSNKGADHLDFSHLNEDNIDLLRNTLKKNYEKFVVQALDPFVIKTLEKMNPKGGTNVVKRDLNEIRDEIQEVEKLSVSENLNFSVKNQINDHISFKQVIKVILFSKYKQIIRELVRIIEDVTYMIFEYKFIMEKYSMTEKLNEQNQKIKQKINDFETEIKNVTSHQKEAAKMFKS